MNKLYEEITVISVLYQENFEILSKCLESVKDFKIILVDNANNKILKKTTKNLIIGNVAARPTETVYGLAGNGDLKGAVQNIFKLINTKKKFFSSN